MAEFKGLQVPDITDDQKKYVIERAINQSAKEFMAAYVICKLDKGFTAVVVEDDAKMAFQISFVKIDYEIAKSTITVE